MTKNLLLAGVLALGLGTGGASAATTVNLAFILDESGSVGSTNYNLAKNALAAALGSVPVADADYVYKVTVISFSSSADLIYSGTINSAGDITALQTAVTSSTHSGGTTNYAPAFNLLGTVDDADISIVNMFTDGDPCCTQAVEDASTAAAAALQGRGWDSLSFEAIGGANTGYLSQLAFDANGSGLQPVIGDSALITDPLNSSFVLTLGNFGVDYQNAVTAKIRRIENPVIPLPAAFPLMAGGLVLLGFVGRRKKAA